MDGKKVDVLVELNFKENEKIKISPIGSFVGVDGRAFLVDEETIKKTKDNKIDLVINENHGFSSSGDKATGWVDINSLEVRADGIYASINWTHLGKELIDKKLYRYLSPEYVMDKNSTDRRVLYLYGLGLVNSPNLLDKALNNKEEEKGLDTRQLEKLEAENDKLKDELKRLGKDLNVKYEEIEELTKEIATQKEINHSLQVDLAIERNQILPAQREFCRELNSTQLVKFIEANSINVEDLKRETPAGGEKQKELNKIEENICKQLGITKEEYLNGNS